MNRLSRNLQRPLLCGGPSTGRLKWSVRPKENGDLPASIYTAPSPPEKPCRALIAIFRPGRVERTVYFGSAMPGLCSGWQPPHPKWKFTRAMSFTLSPAISDGTLFIEAGTVTSMRSMHHGKGEVAVQDRIRSRHLQPGGDPILAADAEAPCTSAAATPTYMPSTRTDRRSGLSITRAPAHHFAAVRDGRVYFALGSSLLYAMDANSGTPIFSLNFQHWPLSLLRQLRQHDVHRH